MKPVFMDNDIGGMVYVGKNQLDLCFANGTNHTFRINTKELYHRLFARDANEWETDKFLIEPMFFDQTWALLVIITVKEAKQDCDTAVVFHCDLLEVLSALEYFPN